MINFEAPNFECNANVLIDGMNYADLPKFIEWERIKNKMKKVLQKINNQEYKFYKFDGDKFIKDFKSVDSPDYIRKPGVEAITFYAFKKDGSFREMQIPNLVHYCAFIYNSLFMFNTIFEVLYLNPENDRYVEHSNSYVVMGENFVLTTGYGNEEEFEEGVFITKNNKVQERMSFEENRRRYNSCQDTFLYSAKIDIESFFPNLYTHYLEKIAQYEPYASLELDKRYFSFLDLFHQRINNNQTKGIPAGLFSSHIAAELLMLCVDYDITEKIKDKNMNYIRYVDDMVFFSDNKQDLESVVSEVQRILGKYRLRINGSKTIYYVNSMYFGDKSNIINMYSRLPYLNSTSSKILKESEFYDFKEYIAELLDKGNIVQIKAIMTRLLTCIKKEFVDLGLEKENWFCYLFTLAFENVNLVCHVYRLLDAIVAKVDGDKREIYIKRFEKKTSLIEMKYCETLFQIWHYYVLTKYMDRDKKQKLLDEYFEKGNINPIIICMFVEDGERKNAKLLDIIKKQFINESEGNDWKKKIMFSRWWLPLMKVRMVDSHNYYGLMRSDMFPEIIADLIV